MCKIILSPCRLQVEASLLLLLRGKKEKMKWLFLTSWTFVIFQSFQQQQQQQKKNPPPLRLEESHSEDFCTYKRWSADFAWSAPPLPAPPPTCSGFGIQLIRNEQKKEKKRKEKNKNTSALDKTATTNHRAMSAASIRPIMLNLHPLRPLM